MDNYFTKKVSFDAFVEIHTNFTLEELRAYPEYMEEVRKEYAQVMDNIGNKPTMHTPQDYIQEWFALEEEWQDNFCLA